MGEALLAVSTIGAAGALNFQYLCWGLPRLACKRREARADLAHLRRRASISRDLFAVKFDETMDDAMQATLMLGVLGAGFWG